MSISFGQLALYSKNKAELSSFLSELIDCDIKATGEAVRLVHEQFSFIIFEDPRSQSSNTNMLVDFFVESSEELEELRLKAQFFAYRFGISHSSEINEDIVSNINHVGPISYFFATDTDGRKWKFSHRLASSN